MCQLPALFVNFPCNFFLESYPNFFWICVTNYETKESWSFGNNCKNDNCKIIVIFGIWMSQCNILWRKSHIFVLCDYIIIVLPWRPHTYSRLHSYGLETMLHYVMHLFSREQTGRVYIYTFITLFQEPVTFMYSGASSQTLIYIFHVVIYFVSPELPPEVGRACIFYYKSSHSARPGQSGMECSTGICFE